MVTVYKRSLDTPIFNLITSNRHFQLFFLFRTTTTALVQAISSHEAYSPCGSDLIYTEICLEWTRTFHHTFWYSQSGCVFAYISLHDYTHQHNIKQQQFSPLPAPCGENKIQEAEKISELVPYNRLHLNLWKHRYHLHLDLLQEHPDKWCRNCQLG